MKKYLIKYLQKQFNKRSVWNNLKKFYFNRWLAELIKNEDNTSHVEFSIAKYFSEIHDIFPFTDLFVIDNIVYVYTERPGYWIGKGGQVIDNIQKSINYNVKGEKLWNFKIRLIENKKGPSVNIKAYLRILNVNEY